MALTVNSNIASINAQRNLERSTTQLNKSLERLSSGLRINRAGDDAAGLAISEGLRSQITGLSQAVRNANDGLSLVGTAEGAMGAYGDMLQRIRELAVQSANDTNSATNRQALQEEVDQLLAEMSRIATSVEYNGTNLLDGSFVAKQLQVGSNVNQTISITTADLRTTAVGAIATTTSGVVTGALSSGDLLLNGTNVGATAADGISFANQTASAISVAAAINSVGGTSGVRATAEPNNVTASVAAVGAVNIDSSTNSLVINGVNIGAVVVQANDADGALQSKINDSANVTGVTASLDATNHLVLTAKDGRNITVTTTGGATPNTTGELLGFSGSGNLAAVTTAGTVKLDSDHAFAIGGATPANAGLAATSIGIDNTTAINTVDISTSQGANTAIEKVDAALRQVISNRASLGAITNRLEITIQSLQTSVENLSASESRIRDADFAAETANLTKNQILQQAGVSILAQANATTQAALQLLRGQ